MEFEGKHYNIMKLLDKVDEYYLACLVILCVGAVISICAIIAPISTWILFPKTRKFQNFIALNRCFMSTLLCLFLSNEAVMVYRLNHILYKSYKDDNMDDYISISEQYSTLFSYLVRLSGYAYISLCCWNTLDSLLCFGSVMKFAKEVRWKYIVVILFCYLAPAPLLVIHNGATLSSEIASTRIFITVMLSEIVILNLVSTCIYICVTIGMFCGKKPEQGETVGTVTTSLIIFIIFGLGYAVLIIINLWDELLKVGSPPESMEFFLPNQNFVLYGIIDLLTSFMPLFLSLSYVLIRKDNRKFWTQYFSKKDSGVVNNDVLLNYS